MTRGPTHQEFMEAELERYKRQFFQDYYPALVEALVLCGLNNSPPPEWVWQEAAARLAAPLNQKSRGTGKQGRAGGLRSAADTDRIHALRWSWAKHWLENRKLLPHFGFKATRGGAFGYVSNQLRGHPAQGEADAIQRSYDKVQLAIRKNRFDRYQAALDDVRWWDKQKPG